MNKLKNKIDYHIKVKKSLLTINNQINKSIQVILGSLNKGGKIMFCGNGGSAADAQHLAAELTVRLKIKNRKAIPALSLALDTSTLTACSNDLNYNLIFSRVLEGLGNKKDVLVVLSTSGNSKNIIEVLKKAKKMKIRTIGFFGNNGGKCKRLCNTNLIVKSKSTETIQECHIFLGHYILADVEQKMSK